MSALASRLKIAVVTLLAAVLLLGAVGAAPAAADTQMTATEGVNIRSGPSTSSAIIGGLYRGQTVTAISSADGWTKIRFLGGVAYIASRYLSKGTSLPAAMEVSAGFVKITTTALNLREGPGLSYDVITVIREGVAVTMTGKTARGFAEVYHGKIRGWASLQYLASASDILPRVIGTRVATAVLNIWAKSSGTNSDHRSAEGHEALDHGRHAERPCTNHLPQQDPLGYGEVPVQPDGDGPDDPELARDNWLPVRHRRAEHPVHIHRLISIDR